MYQTWVFDCDGVILDSNRVKTEAFRQVGNQFGEQVATNLVEYHLNHGGFSRYNKFEYLLTNVLKQDSDPIKVTELANQYSECVYEKLLNCSVVDGLGKLRQSTKDSRWMVVSGSDQLELRLLFKALHIDYFFDAGIYGSPQNKDEIIDEQHKLGNLLRPALFLGDSRYDHLTAKRAGIDFIFVSGWTDFKDWQNYVSQNKLLSINHVSDLI